MVDSEETRHSNCPSPQRLRGWLDGRVTLDEEESQCVSSCPKCQALLDALSTNQELRAWAEAGRETQAAHFQDEPEFKALKVSKIASAFESSNLAATHVPSPQSTAAGQSVGFQQSKDSWFHLSPGELQSRLPGERYQIQKILASGGAGVVYLGFDQQLSREVAIKILTRDSMRDRRRFQREAKVLAEIQHPNVVRIFDMGTLDESESAGQQYLVMEYVGGGPLKGIRQFQDDYKQLAKQMSEAAMGVHAVHQHELIHRDLKPSNFLLDEEGGAIKVADFGLARSVAENSTLVTRTGDIVGTPEYMSPEQVGSENMISAQTDVYGIGATLYTLLTGEPLFQGSPAAVLRQVSEATPVAPRVLNPEIPIELETICLKAIEKEPASRFATAHALSDDLLRFSQGKPVEARPVSTWTKAIRFLRSNPALGSALSIVFLLGTILVIGSATAAAIFRKQSNDLADAVEVAEASTRKAELALKTSVEAASELLVSVTRDAELLPRTPGSQEVSKKLLERARGYFEAFLSANQENPQLKFELARAQSGMAEIADQLGNPEKVHSASQEALRLLDELQQVDSVSQLDELSLRADTLLTYGNFQYDAGEADAAIDLYQKTIQACQAGLKLAGESSAPLDSLTAEFQHWTALAYRGMADAEILNGHEDKTYDYLDEARKLFDILLASAEADNIHRRDAAAVDMTLATTAIDRGENEKGKEYLAAALKLLRSIPEDEPGALQAKERIGVVYTNIGLAERRLGNSEAANDAYDVAIAQHKQLIELEPSVSGHRWNLVVASLNSGGPMMDQGKMEPLVARWKSLVPELDNLIESQPDSMRYLQVKAMLQSNIAIVLRDMGQAERAIAPLQSATEVLKLQAERNGNAPEALLPVALNHYELAQTFHTLNRYQDAIAALSDSDAVVKVLLATHPDFTPAKGHKLDADLMRFNVLLSTEADPVRLTSQATNNLNLAQELHEAQPDVVDYQVELPLAWVQRSQAYFATENLPAAKEHLESAFRMLKEHFADSTDASPSKAWKAAYVMQAQVLATELATAEESDRALLEADLKAALASAREYGASEEELEAFSNAVN